MTLCELQDDPAVHARPELAKQMADLCAETEIREPRKEGLLAKAAAATATGLATSAGLRSFLACRSSFRPSAVADLGMP